MNQEQYEKLDLLQRGMSCQLGVCGNVGLFKRASALSDAALGLHPLRSALRADVREKSARMECVAPVAPTGLPMEPPIDG